MNITVYKFKNGAPLHSYLQNFQAKPMPAKFTLQTLITNVLSICKKESRFDINNNNIILCGSKLTKALNVPALHIKQLKHYICKQLICVDQLSTYLCLPNNRSTTSSNKQKLSAMYCKISPNLKNVFLTLPSFPKHQVEYTYSQICTFMSQYILYHRYRLFDKRNIYVCLIEGDLLQNVFNCKAFHQCQITALMKKNIFFVHYSVYLFT